MPIISYTTILFRRISLEVAGVLRLRIYLGTLMFLSACSLDGVVNVEDAEGKSKLERGAIVSRWGAIGMYYSALEHLQKAVSANSLDVGLMTDELTSISFSAFGTGHLIDARVASADHFGQMALNFNAYSNLHAARVGALHARMVLNKLQDSSVTHLIAGTYSIEGYAVTLLAENGCSGIPLSTFPFEGEVTYSSGYSTSEAFVIAVQLFDSALAVVHDSARFTTLARIGKGRAYLGLGRLDSARAAVNGVAPEDAFTLTYTDNPRPGTTQRRDAFWTSSVVTPRSYVELSNHEGGNGLVWYSSSGDPRVPTRVETVNGITGVVVQRKFIGGGITFQLARWVEAKMIEAEYYLSINDPAWLTSLNEARRSVSLSDTTDPGTVEERIDLLFRERAYWFFLEGVRLSDYRRLVRQYQRSPYLIYPTGAYTKRSGEISLYGNAFVFSGSENNLNHEYQGCQHANP